MQNALAAAFFVLICALGAAAQNVTNGTNCSSIPPPCGWNAMCVDIDNGTVCLCDIGYWLNSTFDCEVCPWGTWGWECSNECNCTDVVLDNSTTCDPVNGTCPDDGIYNCNDYPCGDNTLCRDVDDTFECYCNPGYQLANETTCEVCPWGTWGWDCSNECNCTDIVLDNSTTCDPVNGTCPDDGIYNCNDYPCGDNTLCRDVDDTFECYCNPGYQLANETTCEECSWNTWGFNCSGSCNCTDNSTTCNTVTGLCPEDEINCASGPCGVNAECVDISIGVYLCYCTTGYMLVDDHFCFECPAGTWGLNCTNNCTCGSGGNGCHHMTGQCECNSCYRGMMCGQGVGADCVQDFLEVEQKCDSGLREMFGGDQYPVPPDNTLTNLAVELMDLDNAAVIQEEPEYAGASRDDVDQGPLVKLTWKVDKNADRPNAERGLDRLAEEVKLGNIRCTLIINSQEESAQVTLNSGIRKCEDDSS